MTQIVTRVNGSATLTGTLYNKNCNLFLIAVQNTNGSAINLQLEDSSTTVDGVIESIVKETCPLAYFTPTNSSGYIHVVMDIAIDDFAALQLRIRRIGLQSNGTTSIGPNSVDISGTLVTAATTLTVS